ncbi:MAG: helix-turn-helix domain-containing protein [Daejeonella sp.]|uniref:helix-turn-helix domain-containing protein n=1 Tax=Daejeonella sp. JGW-45 TaxID=3034148 RepID=UPI0023EB55C7|nr:helix-turn-helix transcriptional regulator [Daejeonella sp. JGW-45]
MRKYFDEASARQIGERIRAFRKDRGYSLEDISAMTGFSVNTISSIENGGDTYLSYCIAICRAIGVEPAELFKIELDLKPRFELPPDRRSRALTTHRVNQLFESGFFETPKLVVSVLEEFESTYGIQPESSEVSTALKKLSSEGRLQYTKVGRRNLYVKKK